LAVVWKVAKWLPCISGFFCLAAVGCCSCGVGLGLFCFWFVGAGCFGCLPTALAFPCFHVGLFVLPLCGAAPTFLCPPRGLPSGRRRKEK
jgi:hypothetical protein